MGPILWYNFCHDIFEGGNNMPQDAGPSYKRKEPFVLDDHHKRVIAGAVAEVDPKQIAVLRALTPARRFSQAISMIAFAEKVAVHRLRPARA